MSAGLQTPAPPADPAVTFRPGTPADSYACFVIFEHSLADLLKRMGSNRPTSLASAEAMATMWAQRQPLYSHLAETADQFWIAERAGEPIGFARAITRDGLQQLTELFITPGSQSHGAGRELLARTFPRGASRIRAIIASADLRAQTLYLRAGLLPRTPVYYFSRVPQMRPGASDLLISAVSGWTPGILDELGAIDCQILEHRRDADHRWLLDEREGYLYSREGRPVGYGYLGRMNGPFALLEAADFPAVLAHAETMAAIRSDAEFGVEVPLLNQTAVDALAARGFQLDSFVGMIMSDQRFGRLQNYILSSPPFFL